MQVLELVELEWLQYLRKELHHLTGSAAALHGRKPLVKHSYAGYIGGLKEFEAWALKLHGVECPVTAEQGSQIAVQRYQQYMKGMEVGCAEAVQRPPYTPLHRVVRVCDVLLTEAVQGRLCQLSFRVGSDALQPVLIEVHWCWVPAIGS